MSRPECGGRYRWAKVSTTDAGLGGRSGPPQVSVIVAGGGASVVLAAKAATTTIRSVFKWPAPIPSRPGSSEHQPARWQHHRRLSFCHGLEAKRLGLVGTKWFPSRNHRGARQPELFRRPKTSCARLQEAAARLASTRCRACQLRKAISMPRHRPSSNSGLGVSVLCIPILHTRREQLVVLAASSCVPDDL